MAKNTSAKSTFSNLYHVAVVVRDIDKTVKRLEAMGIGPFRAGEAPPGAEGMFYRGKPLAMDFKELIAKLGDIELELFQPGEKPSPWKEFLETRGEGLHHLGFRVDDVEKEIDRLTKQGAEVTLTAKAYGKIAGAYLDLKAGGIIVELAV